MKKSFAENCIRYISTATALILALAMLCCANFSAGAKNLGSNLTITDTTSLLEDINTTTNTTPAKTKDLIASGANVELVSTGITVGDTIYFCSTTEYSTVYAYIWKKDGSSYNTWDSEEAMTPLGNIDGKYYYSYTLIGSSTTDFDRVIFKKGNGDANKLTSDVTIDSNNNCYDLDNTSWSTYSGGSSGTTTKTVYFDNSDSKWANVYAWVWKEGSNGESVQLTRVGTTNVYSMEVSTDKDCVIFKPNSGNNFDSPRTKDLNSSLPNNMADGYMFSFTNYSSTSDQNTGTWTEYSATTTYTVTFHANGYGTDPSSQTVTSGGKATVPTPPTAEGWTFSGWYKESECTTEYDFDTPVTGNLDLYAKWTKNASSDVSEDILAILNGTKTQAYFGHPSSSWKTDIYLKGGSSDLNKTKIGTTTLSDVSYYYADFTLDSTTNLKNYYISDASGWNGVKINKDELVVGGAFYYIINSGENDGNHSVRPTTAQTTLGATSFIVGTTDKLPVTTKATKATSSTGNALKYQYYIKNGTNYLRLGSSDIDASTSDTTTEFDISTLPKGTYELITMLYDGHIYYVSDTTETDSFTISDSYTVTFNANSHGDNTETPVEPGGTVSAPTPAPTATGYTFGGWYTDENCTDGNEYNFSRPVTGDLTLYAKWTENKYTVSFDSQGGNNTPTDMEVTYDGTYGTLPSAGTKTGYDFAGWYTSATGGTQVTETTKVTITAPQTLYAQWTAKTYTVTLNKDGGTINSGDVTSYTYGVGAPLPTDVTKDGYTFLGWKDDETESMVESISKTDTGNKSFTARWKLNTFEHHYVFMEVSGKTWFYNNSSYGVVSFDGGTTYIDMQELFTNTSTYNSSAKKGNLLFAKVPEGTTTIIFSRKNTTNGVVSKNKTTYKYTDYTTNNLLTLASGNDTLNGSWSTVDYTPVPVSVTHGANGTVVASKTLADTTTTITVKNGETKYFASATEGISVAVTPATDYQISSFTVNDNDKISVFEGKLETGGTYNLEALSEASCKIQAAFEEVQKENPTVTIENIPNSTINSTISFKYTDPAGTVQTATAPGDYVVQYKSNISLVISPKAGYHLVSITGLTTESTLPVAGNVTATATQVKADLTVSYELAPDPKVTVICCDTNGTQLGAEKVTLKFGETVIDNGKQNTVSYNSDTGVTFTAETNKGQQYRFLGYYTTTTTPIGSPITSGGIDDYDVTVDGNSINIYHVTSDITLYAIFSQQYKVTFNYKNLTNFTVDGTAVATGGSVYVSAGANLSLEATISDDYKLTNDYWSITPTGVGTFAPNGTNASYTVGTSDVEITITPQIATYTGEGKWGSKTLKIDTSSVGTSKTDYDPWFAAKFATSSSGTTYTWVRFNKISDSSYECVVPDGYNYVKFCRMATKATSFTDKTTDDIDATTAWNVTDSFVSLGNTSSEYTLAYTGTVGKISATEKKKTNN